MLKFEDLRKGDILVSPWGSEVEVLKTDNDELHYAVTGGKTWWLIKDTEFEAVFGGWEIKDKNNA